MKKLFAIFIPLVFIGCKENEPELSKDFEGTFYLSEKSDIGTLNVEWRITQDGPKLVDIASRADFKYSDSRKPNELRIVTIENVKVESGKVLTFDNSYSYDAQKIKITGKAILTGDRLTIDIKEANDAGESEYTAKDLYRR